jgi:ribosomal protein S18 acetylase RimI-like enzyme
MLTIRIMSRGDVLGRLSELMELLRDAVDGGASVGFLPPLTTQEAQAYWETILGELDTGARILLGAFQGETLVGAVQLELALRANGRHRAEVQKFMVFSTARRQGVAQALMEALEEEARREGRSLLILDTRQGDPSEALYRKLGYTVAGVIPQFARSANGELHPTVFLYKLVK